MYIAVRTAAAGRHGEDRAAAVMCESGHVLLVADGAGGRAGGAAAAEAVLRSVQCLTSLPSDWVAWLEELDQPLQSAGETTAVVVFLAHGQLCGASVGDSRAWLVSATERVDLTAHQRRKPLLGSGHALAVGFGPVPQQGSLLLASDGLFNYVPHERIQQLLCTLTAEAAAAALIEAARLPTGALCDDIAVIVASQGRRAR